MKSNDKNGKGTGMKSHEVFQELQDAGFNKSIMAETSLCKSQISRWSQPGDVSNPLERTGQLVEATPGHDAVQLWLGERLKCTLVPNPEPKAPAPDLSIAVGETDKILMDLLGLLAVVLTRKRVSREDAARLRRLWERVKARVEGFIQACERGIFRCGAFFLSLGWWFTTGEVLVMEAV